MFDSLKHHDKVAADLKAAQTRLQELEAEAPVLRAHLADLIADETATSKDIAAARAAVNKHPGTIAAAREEADILTQAVTRAHSAAVAAAAHEWAALVKEAAEGVGVPLAGVQDAAGPVCDIADQLQERWQAYRRALQTWHQTFPSHKPPPLGFPRPTIQMQNIIGSMTEAARLLRDVQKAVD